jgi:glucosamine kinase
MILIADSGSTKTDWVLTDANSRYKYRTVGYNPYFIDSENIYRSLEQKLIPHFNPSEVKHVYFYGAGCSTNENKEVVNQALLRCFGDSRVSVGHDMLAAARALLHDKPGFAAIIGTGSNTCLYDGKDVSMNIDSLGYLLGDEGSGAYIGKKILRDYMRRLMPRELMEQFRAKYNVRNDEIFDNLYHRESPNRYLASFCLFADEHRAEPHIRAIVRESFNDFFKNLVSKYPNFRDHSFNCVGSVGFIFKEILADVGKAYGMTVEKVLHSPIDELVEYHLKRQVVS